MAKFKLLFGLALPMLLAACADHELPISEVPGDVPPQLVHTKSGAIGWDNPKAFGRLPGNEVRQGLAACHNLDTMSTKYVPIGYHPDARDLNGNPIPGGGFYCVSKY